MSIEKRTFRIGELARHLNVERFVIRFWEKEFGIEPHRSEGGQRYYTDEELKKFECIKELLYKEKFTIAGARNHLKQMNGDQYLASLSLEKTDDSDIQFKLRTVYEQLQKLKKLL